MKHSITLLSLLALGLLISFSGCDKDDDEPTPPPHNTFRFSPAADVQTQVQEALITMEDGDTIHFEAGTFNFSSTLSIDSKQGIVFRGEGHDQTTLDFSGQTAGAEGIKASSTDWILFQDFTVQDAQGDNIKVKDADGVSFINVHSIYTGPADETNGAYALYPVTSRNVLIDGCHVQGASDAGIYVGQSEQVIVRNSSAVENVAGIEIENCINSDVYGNTMRNNTGGLLVFDLPNLPVIKNGSKTRVYNNTIEDNSHRNFAPAGNIVGSVPEGCGVMLLAAKDVEIFNNTITNNNVMGIGIISYITLAFIDPGNTYEDSLYVPYGSNIYIHNNTISRTTTYPADQNDVAQLLTDQFPAGDIRDIVYDGWVRDDITDTNESICIQDNGSATFVDINVQGLFGSKRYDLAPHDCVGNVLQEVTVDAPGM